MNVDKTSSADFDDMRSAGRRVLLCLLSLTCASEIPSAAAEPPPATSSQYRLPPQEISDILDAPPLPKASLAPHGRWLLLAHSDNLPGIATRAVPVLGLAGRRVNPATHGPYGIAGAKRFSLVRLSDGQQFPVATPTGSLTKPLWSPDGHSFLFLRTVADGNELWIADAERQTTRPLGTLRINDVSGRESPCRWLPDSRRAVCHFIPTTLPSLPPSIPAGPSIQETSGEHAPVWTYANLLQSPRDEALYDYYMTSQPRMVDITTGDSRPVGAPAIYQSLEPSPDGNYLLSIRNRRPYSYLVPSERFPKVVEILDAQGERVRTVAELRLDTSSVALGWAYDGPREFEWQMNAPATLAYVEALDGGDWKRTARFRDRLLLLAAPFDGEPVELMRTEWRMGGFRTGPRWGERGLALVTETDWEKRRKRLWRVQASRPGKPALLWEVAMDDWYADPGEPLLTPGEPGDQRLIQQRNWIYLAGRGGSPQGDRPFLDRLDVDTGRRERLFRSESASYEDVIAILDPAARYILTTYETSLQPPNYYLRDRVRGTRQALTTLTHPGSALASVRKMKIEYSRADGVQLNGDLYLPLNYRSGQPVPVLVWAYPEEFATTQGTGQVRGSLSRFTWASKGASHLLLLTQGYAILDNASMPIVGGATANDSYVEQLVANARAAVDKLVAMGITRADTVAVGGHSYGAFMTANLLAHSDIFAAGIAMSGAYNRTLTPFGFQRERRSLWEAPQLYARMSPFNHADRIHAPLLLIHGAVDGNPGTDPTQSQRMYHAVKGLGGTARLVMLPHEDHGYVSRESVMHVMWEMTDWLNRFVNKDGIRSAMSRAGDGNDDVANESATQDRR